MTQWRLLAPVSADGATNMAQDAALLASVAAGGAPVLRFYHWSTPCLSLGYSQKATVLDADRCQAQGWQIVRRLTGGRTVLHTDEITYMLCAPVAADLMQGGVLASYKRISRGLANGLQRTGIALQPASAEARADTNSIACFDTPSASEIVFRGRKLLGSAQTRRQSVVLQHGSLPLSGDVGQIADGLRLTDQARIALQKQLRQHATTLTYALGQTPDPARVIAHLCAGLRAAGNLDLQPSELTAIEERHTIQLRAEIYANRSWTERR